MRPSRRVRLVLGLLLLAACRPRPRSARDTLEGEELARLALRAGYRVHRAPRAPPAPPLRPPEEAGDEGPFIVQVEAGPAPGDGGVAPEPGCAPEPDYLPEARPRAAWRIEAGERLVPVPVTPWLAPGHRLHGVTLWVFLRCMRDGRATVTVERFTSGASYSEEFDASRGEEGWRVEGKRNRWIE
jgi:hypothetical protein